MRRREVDPPNPPAGSPLDAVRRKNKVDSSIDLPPRDAPRDPIDQCGRPTPIGAPLPRRPVEGIHDRRWPAMRSEPARSAVMRTASIEGDSPGRPHVDRPRRSINRPRRVATSIDHALPGTPEVGDFDPTSIERPPGGRSSAHRGHVEDVTPSPPPGGAAVLMRTARSSASPGDALPREEAPPTPTTRGAHPPPSPHTIASPSPLDAHAPRRTPSTSPPPRRASSTSSTTSRREDDPPARRQERRESSRSDREGGAPSRPTDATPPGGSVGNDSRRGQI
jgi:hypothetical protein